MSSPNHSLDQSSGPRSPLFVTALAIAFILVACGGDSTPTANAELQASNASTSTTQTATGALETGTTLNTTTSSAAVTTATLTMDAVTTAPPPATTAPPRATTAPEAAVTTPPTTVEEPPAGDSPAGLVVVSRTAWGARAADASKLVSHTLQRLTVHHAGDQTTTTGPTRFRSWQAWHMDGRGWGDISYHYIVGVDGVVYEGRDVSFRTDTGTGYDTTGRSIFNKSQAARKA